MGVTRRNGLHASKSKFFNFLDQQVVRVLRKMPSPAGGDGGAGGPAPSAGAGGGGGGEESDDSMV